MSKLKTAKCFRFTLSTMSLMHYVVSISKQQVSKTTSRWNSNYYPKMSVLHLAISIFSTTQNRIISSNTCDVPKMLICRGL